MPRVIAFSKIKTKTPINVSVNWSSFHKVDCNYLTVLVCRIAIYYKVEAAAYYKERKLKMFEKYPDILNVGQLCAALGVGRNTVYELIKSGQIRTVRIGRIHKIPKLFLIQFVEAA